MSINDCTQETPAALRYTYLNFLFLLSSIMPAKVALSFSAAFLRASEVSHGRAPLLALNQVRVLVADLCELA